MDSLRCNRLPRLAEKPEGAQKVDTPDVVLVEFIEIERPFAIEAPIPSLQGADDSCVARLHPGGKVRTEVLDRDAFGLVIDLMAGEVVMKKDDLAPFLLQLTVPALDLPVQSILSVCCRRRKADTYSS